nr:unnamed protein product [Spirometra erinaceieuropaei]
MGRPLPRRPQPSLPKLQRRYRPSAASRDQVDLGRPPSLYETIRAKQKHSSRKAPRSDAIPTEIYKRGCPQLMDHLTAPFQVVWHHKKFPHDFQDVTIVHPYKQKGNRQFYDNYRGISLLHIAGEIFAPHYFQPPEQPSGTRSPVGRPVRHHPLSRDHGHELCRPSTTGEVSKDADPHVFYVRGSDESLRHGESRRTVENHAKIRLSRTFHSDDAPVPRRHDGASHGQRSCLKAFAVTNGVKQGCVLAPTLFNFMFSAILMDVCRDERPGILIAYRTDGELLYHWRMDFQSRVSTKIVHELLFADDCALNTTMEGNMQSSMDSFAAACDIFGLVIYTEKTVVMNQPPPKAAYVAPQLNVNCTQLQVADNFCYLGSTLSCTNRPTMK